MVYEDRGVTYEIIKHIGVIKEQSDGWTREVNIVSWNGGEPKIDIRSWTDHHKRMSRGITLSIDEMDRLVDLYTKTKEEPENEG